MGAAPTQARVGLAGLAGRGDGEGSQGVGTVVMKNWLPFVPGPALAMDSVKGRSCRRFLQPAGAGRGRGPGQGRQGGASQVRRG